MAEQGVKTIVITGNQQRDLSTLLAYVLPRDQRHRWMTATPEDAAVMICRGKADAAVILAASKDDMDDKVLTCAGRHFFVRVQNQPPDPNDTKGSADYWTAQAVEVVAQVNLIFGKVMVSEQEARWRELGSRIVRVRRVLVYQGPADKMREQIAQSLPVGVKRFGYDNAPMSITVYQDEIEEVEEP